MSSPYDRPGFYAEAIAAGRHRDIVGGRWDETGRAQMAILRAAGMRPDHHLLDIGAGALRLGCKAVPYLEPGHYWATDPSRALMLAGHARELDDPARLDPAHLVGDAVFAFPGIPDTITHAIAFGVFAHLPATALEGALRGLRRFTRLEWVGLTVFVLPQGLPVDAPFRQKDGVVTHGGRAPRHLPEPELHRIAAEAGWNLIRDDRMLPRGQVLFRAQRQAG